MKIIGIFVSLFFIVNSKAALNCDDNFKTLKKAESYLEGVLSFEAPKKELLLFSVNLDRTQRADKKGSFKVNNSFKYKHLKKYSFYRPEEDSPINIVDIYFHGQEGKPAILLKSVDLYYFLHRRLNSKNEKFNCLRKIQGHFSEYRRKSKVFKKNVEKEIFFNGKNFDVLVKADQRKFFFDAYPLNEFVLTNNCRGIGSFEYEWPGFLKGYLQLEPEFFNKVMSSYDGVFNCQKNMVDGFTNQLLGTEARTTPYYAWQLEMSKARSGVVDYAAMWYSIISQKNYYWYNTGDFSKVDSKNCKITDIKELLIKKDQKISKRPLTHAVGKIPYEDFSSETQMKSGYNRMGEALSYISSPCFGDKKPKKIPQGYIPPRPHNEESTKKYWSKSPCQLGAYHYVNFEDIFKYPLHLSMFEVDGVYTGKSQDWGSHSAINRHDFFLLKDRKKRVPFDVSYLNDYEIVTISENLSHLSFEFKNKMGKNLYIGNIPKSELNSEESKKKKAGELFTSNRWSGLSALIGLDPQPLSSYYNDFNLGMSNTPLFSYFYDNDGQVLNHHDPKVGVELFYVRKKGCDYIVDLVSHERILPLKRLSFKYGCKK